MRILFECDNGAYVVELCEKRLYAKVHPDNNTPTYSSTFSNLLNPASFHEYRDENTMLENRVEKVITTDLKKALK